MEDTHLTLIGILSKVEANNSLIFLPLQTYEKKFAEFPFLFISIISWRKQLVSVSREDNYPNYIKRKQLPALQQEKTTIYIMLREDNYLYNAKRRQLFIQCQEKTTIYIMLREDNYLHYVKG